MSTVRPIADRLPTNTLENENILIVDYWLDYVAATDEREETQCRSFNNKDLESTFDRYARRTTTVPKHRVQRRQTLEEAFPISPTRSDESFPALMSGESPQGSPDSHEPSLLARSKLRIASRLRNSGLFDLFSKLT